MDLCKYKDIFGKPNEGIHSYRFLNIAIVDVLATIVVAFLISHFTKFCFGKTLLALFLCGIVMHRLFCVKTTVDKFIFG